MRYVIGIDVGTTATKALLVSEDGRVMAQASQRYGLSTPSPGFVEQSPQDLWQACVSTVRAVLSDNRSRDVVAIGLSTQGGTIVGLDEDRVPTGMAITWLDKRGEGEVERLVEEKGASFFVERTGMRAPGLVIPRLLWVKAHQPQRFAGTRHWAFVNDYIVSRLTGHLVADPSNVCLCGLYNLWTNSYDPEMLALGGLSEEMLAPIAESGTVAGTLTPAAAQELGLSPSTVVAAAGHDQYCAALGAGIVSPGSMLLSCGTAWVLLSPTDAPTVDSTGDTLPGRHLLPGLYGVLGVISNGSVVWDWFSRILFGDAVDYEEIERTLGSIPPGCEGLRCWPGFLRADTPLPVGPGGALLGLSLSLSRGHILRSVMEGLALEARRRAEHMAQLGVGARTLSMIGGAAQSRLWPQIVSDVLNVRVTVPENKEAAALGAAVLGLKAAGLIPHLREGCRRAQGKERRISPDPSSRHTYDVLYEKHKAIVGQ
jgi:xylulokinase